MIDFPIEVNDAIQAKVSLDRIQKYLDEKNIERYDLNFDRSLYNANPEFLGFKNASFRYFGSNDEASDSNQAFSLRNLNCTFPENKLSVIIGPTGAGKSSIVLALLGELETLSGKVGIPRTEVPEIDPRTGFTTNIAYVAQSAWLINGTIRDNICFGEPFDEKKYQRVVEGCSLSKDFSQFPGGDLTEVGEKGINLSGGQKQRISLARACYTNAGLVLLDDPLSAVDAPTARFLLHRCILGLLQGRTVILVTNATHLVLPYADHVISVVRGEITHEGSPEELSRIQDGPIAGVVLDKEPFLEDADEKLAPETSKNEVTALIEEETKEVGAVKLKVYQAFTKAAGGWIFIGSLIVCFLVQVSLQRFMDYWLKIWTESYRALFYYLAEMTSRESSLNFNLRNYINIQSGDNHTLYYLGYYALIGLALIVAGIVQELVVRIAAWSASKRFHKEMLNSVIYSPLRFFETTPIGRILNRFSRDIEVTDFQVGFNLLFFFWQVFSAIFTVVIIGSIAPIFLLGVPVVGALYLYFAKSFVSVSRELKRIESVSKSPIYSSFSETLTGVVTIRAFGAIDRFSNINTNKVDANNKAFLSMWTANRWLGVRIGILSGFIIFASGAAVVQAGLGAGWTALTLTFALDLTFQLKFAIRMHANVEMSMNSVERIDEYSHLTPEPPAIIQGNRPHASWPEFGKVEVKNVSIRYAEDLPDVLQNVSFSVQAGEKLAVVGRTGAGKSTLSLAFFRIVPFSSGSIFIDDLDIGSIGLYDLRSKLTMIPQGQIS
jgi:ABC-type multidrug transport system fused ATPase/permease subunit